MAGSAERWWSLFVRRNQSIHITSGDGWAEWPRKCRFTYRRLGLSKRWRPSTGSRKFAPLPLFHTQRSMATLCCKPRVTESRLDSTPLLKRTLKTSRQSFKVSAKVEDWLIVRVCWWFTISCNLEMAACGETNSLSASRLQGCRSKWSETRGRWVRGILHAFQFDEQKVLNYTVLDLIVDSSCLLTVLMLLRQLTLGGLRSRSVLYSESKPRFKLVHTK